MEGEIVASGTEATLNLLEDAERRPPVPLIEVPRGLLEHMSAADFGLDQDKFDVISVLMISEHLRPLLSKTVSNWPELKFPTT